MPTRPPLLSVLIRLTRFGNLLIIGLTQYCTAGFLVSPETLLDWRLLALASSTILIAAAGYVINDYYDVKIDLINKPERVVVGKWLPRRFALLLHTVLSLLGVALGSGLSWLIGTANFLSAFLLWAYSNQLKRLPLIGNLSIGLLTGAAVLMVEALYQSHSVLIYIYALFAFFITVVREIAKDMEDLKGDNTFGCKTLPIVWGIRKTKQFTYGVLAVFVWLVIGLNVAYAALPMLFFLPTLFIPLAWLTWRLYRADTKKDYYHVSQWCKAIMLLGVLSMAFVA
ncbi:MAG: geranylgeranylglycerol-phosphate geranylgeranyltransferase [Cyclobacteriaceae bacterium]|jgi:4-hydroxybenzoate polyprenyltransferase|nr:geranylgeranylglycerol-phosphate geranylgeranyltransferase [Cyclobacteriaceae bacterium]